MTTNFEELVTPALIRETFQDHVIGADKGWGITVCGRLLSIEGKTFFKSREAAVKSFYNSFHWRVKRYMHYANPRARGQGYWQDPNRTAYWKAFKTVLERDYNLKFIKL